MSIKNNNSLYVSILSYFFLVFLLLLSSSYDNVTTVMAGRSIPSSAPSTVVRPLTTEYDRDYVSLRPRLNPNHHQVFGGREVKGCLPKGFRHASAPSRFVNFHTLGTAGCSPDVHAKKP